MTLALCVLALAAGRAAASETVGFDVSYPQCRTGMPGVSSFAIVGVNSGWTTSENPCLARQLRWALTSTRGYPQASFYIDTADPGPRVSDWPRHGASPYGACHGSWSYACAYLYGAQRAEHSYRFVSALDAGLARAAPWWLDIETSSSWARTVRSLNRAAIQGFVAGLHRAGVRQKVGMYSTALQWWRITGLGASTTPGAFGGSPHAWVASSIESRASAQRLCSLRSFTGAVPELVQYQSGGFDVDLRC
ncbi:MAG: hypothetical protein J2O48_08095 [Solirubrobacterales bacterium]|nr:hypothetical protein [Solirubrobacterales bacterium]